VQSAPAKIHILDRHCQVTDCYTGSPDGGQGFAREEYFMKKPNEDVYIIKNK